MGEAGFTCSGEYLRDFSPRMSNSKFSYRELSTAPADGMLPSPDCGTREHCVDQGIRGGET